MKASQDDVEGVREGQMPNEERETRIIILEEIFDDVAVEPRCLPRLKFVILKEDPAWLVGSGSTGQSHHLVKVLSNLTKYP